MRRHTPVELPEIHSEDCTPAHRLAALGAVPFFSGLSEAELAEVHRLFRTYGYQPGDTIYSAGDRAERLFVVAHGKVKLLRHTASGQDVLLGILGADEMFGSLAALGDAEYPDEAEAHTSTCVLGIGARDFQSLLERYPAVALAVLTILAERLKESHETISQLSAMPVESRVAAALLKLAEKLGTPHEGGSLIQAPLSREDLAALTGSTTESVSRVMSKLRRDRIIDSGRRWVAILAPERLASLTGEGDLTTPAAR